MSTLMYIELAIASTAIIACMVCMWRIDEIVLWAADKDKS